ncbi:hypothetical protein ACH4U3_34330 [Streptomyces griseoruber]|uniref:hypothetical protein n=1 Tax=Streptomyces griseoruber TaxID=1943 RepID=UPI003797F484
MGVDPLGADPDVRRRGPGEGRGDGADARSSAAPGGGLPSGGLRLLEQNSTPSRLAALAEGDVELP